MKKLTLSVDLEIIEEARKLARQSGTSVSSMFARFVQFRAQYASGTRHLGPLTRKASGMIVLPKGRSGQQVLEDALREKYGLR